MEMYRLSVSPKVFLKLSIIVIASVQKGLSCPSLRTLRLTYSRRFCVRQSSNLAYLASCCLSPRNKSVVMNLCRDTALSSAGPTSLSHFCLFNTRHVSLFFIFSLTTLVLLFSEKYCFSNGSVLRNGAFVYYAFYPSELFPG